MDDARVTHALHLATLLEGQHDDDGDRRPYLAEAAGALRALADSQAALAERLEAAELLIEVKVWRACWSRRPSGSRSLRISTSPSRSRPWPARPEPRYDEPSHPPREETLLNAPEPPHEIRTRTSTYTRRPDGMMARSRALTG